MNKFAEWMAVNKLTDKEVGERVHVHPAHVCRVRNSDRRITPSFAWKFGEAYGFKLAQELYNEQDKGEA